MKKLKICLVLLCLLTVRSIGMPQFHRATFFMKKIKMPCGRTAKVDDSDYEALIKYKWTSIKRGEIRYARMIIYYDHGEKEKQVLLHRVLLGLTDPSEVCDHKDGDGLNNQRSNLRKCDRTRNAYNKQKSKNPKSSAYKGVYFSKGDKKWYGLIQAKNIKYGLGAFDDEMSAAIAYNKKAIELFGEFAKLNSI